MGSYGSAYWLTDTWGSTRRERQSGVYHPYQPDHIAGLDLPLTPEAAAAASQAERDIAQLNARATVLTNTEPLARLILRSEALASSRIEGLELGAGKLLEFEALGELGVPHALDRSEALVLNNIRAMESGIRHIVEAPRMSIEQLCVINRRLMQGAPGEEKSGMLRTEQNWIGGNRVNPLGARYVPPTPDAVPELMEDLMAFCRTSRYSPIATAAIAHAQFETIHPFIDGNGRTGRVLVQILLTRAGLTPHVMPPISLILATDKTRYLDNLAAYRVEGSLARENQAAVEALSSWVEYVAWASSLACRRADEFEQVMREIRATWRQRCHTRAGSAASLLIDVLPSNPVVSVSSAARLTGRSTEAARQAIHTLCERGILVQRSKNRKSGLYAAVDALDAFTSYERALATLSGDTSAEKPRRHVPQRRV